MKMEEIGPKEGVRVPSASQPEGQILSAQTIVILKLCTNTMTHCLAQILYHWVVPFSNHSIFPEHHQMPVVKNPQIWASQENMKFTWAPSSSHLYF